MPKKHKWGGESVVKNRKGKEVPDALSWKDVKVMLFGKEITGITEITYEDENTITKDVTITLKPEMDQFVAFDDHLRL